MTRRAVRYTLCPRCEAEKAIAAMRHLCARAPSPESNWYAHATGVGEGTLESLLRYPLKLCTKHRKP